MVGPAEFCCPFDRRDPEVEGCCLFRHRRVERVGKIKVNTNFLVTYVNFSSKTSVKSRDTLFLILFYLRLSI